MQFETFAEKQDLIFDGIPPIIPIVYAWAQNEVMFNAERVEFLVKLAVDVVKEVVFPTVENDFEFPVLYSFHLIHKTVLVPYIIILVEISEQFAYFPIVGECANVHAAAHASYGPENVRMSESEKKCSLSAHAESGDSAILCRGYSLVVSIDIVHQFFGCECFVENLFFG